MPRASAAVAVKAMNEAQLQLRAAPVKSVSFVTVRELRVREAFATDHRFRQAGFLALLKP